MDDANASNGALSSTRSTSLLHSEPAPDHLLPGTIQRIVARERCSQIAIYLQALARALARDQPIKRSQVTDALQASNDALTALELWK